MFAIKKQFQILNIPHISKHSHVWCLSFFLFWGCITDRECSLPFCLGDVWCLGLCFMLGVMLVAFSFVCFRFGDFYLLGFVFFVDSNVGGFYLLAALGRLGVIHWLWGAREVWCVPKWCKSFKWFEFTPLRNDCNTP